MKLISKQQIDQFLACKSIAIAGASRKEKSFSADVAKHLAKLGYNLWYVNPEFEQNEVENQHVQSVDLLPSDLNLLVLTNKSQTAAIIQQAISKGIRNVWIQQMSDTPEALELGSKNGLNLIHHQCIFMFTQPNGIHKFHYTVKKIFGRMPK